MRDVKDVRGVKRVRGIPGARHRWGVAVPEKDMKRERKTPGGSKAPSGGHSDSQSHAQGGAQAHARAHAQAGIQAEEKRLLDYLSPEWLNTVRSLELRARLVVEGFLVGLHRSPYKGFSVEFSEHRPYTFGDEPRRIDWKVFARTRRLYVKEFRAETNVDAFFIMDFSRSMHYGEPVSKLQYANTCAASLAFLLNLQGDRVGLFALGRERGEGRFLSARGRKQDVARFLGELSRLEKEEGAALPVLVSRAAEFIKKRSLVVIASDFLAPRDELREAVTHIGFGGHDVVLLWILSDDEARFPFMQPTVFVEPESGRKIITEPDAVRASYLSALKEHGKFLEDTVGRFGGEVLRMVTTENYALALSEFLSARKREKIL